MQELVTLLASVSVLGLLVSLVMCALGLRRRAIRRGLSWAEALSQGWAWLGAELSAWSTAAGSGSSAPNPQHFRTSRVWRAFLVLVWVWVAAVFLVLYQAQPGSAGGVGYAEFYVLGGEEDILAALTEVNPRGNTQGPIHSRLSIVAGAPGVNIYLDERENGYSVDSFDPSTADAQWFLPKIGDVLTLCDEDHASRPVEFPECDGVAVGGDRLYYVVGAASVVRIIWPDTPVASYLAGAWELYPTNLTWRNRYVVPVGEDLDFAPDSTLPFEYTFLFIQAAEDNTQVWVNGTPVATLNQGDNTYLPDINAGTTVTATGLIQAGLITSVNGVYDSRYYTLTPEEWLCREYYLPVPSMQFPAGEFGGRDVETAAYIYAFQDNTVVTIETSAGTETVTLDAGEVHRYVMPPIPRGTIEGPYGVRITSSDEIWILVAGDDDAPDLDWGYQALCAEPQEARKYELPVLGSEYYLPFAPANPLHITPVDDDTTFFVDWNNDGDTDETFVLDRFDTRMLFDPDEDATGAHIYADGRFAMAWGQDNTEGTFGEPLPDFDFGYTVLPMLFDLFLGCEKTVDQPSLPCEGGAVTFTVTVFTGAYPMYGIDISDTLPSGWRYLTGTTTIRFSDGTPDYTDDPAGAPGPDLLWALGHDLDPQQSITVTFGAETIPGAYSPEWQENWGEACGEDENRLLLCPRCFAFVSIPNASDCFIRLAKTVYLCRDDGGAGCPGSESVTGAKGAHVTYCFEVTNINTDTIYLDDITINDPLLGIDETQMTLLRGSTPLAPEASLVYYYEGTINGDLFNTAKTEGNPTDANGNPLGLDNPTWSDTATVKEESQPTTIELSKTVYRGRDGGAGCPGSERVTGANGDHVTYCFEVANTGDTYLASIVITDTALGIPPATVTLQAGMSDPYPPLAPADSLVYYYEGTINGNLVNKAKTQGIPTDAEGNNLPCLPDPTDEDTAEVGPTPTTPRKDDGTPTVDNGTETPTPTPTPTLVTPTATVPIVERLPETGRFPGGFTVFLGVLLIIGAASLLNLALLEKRGRRGDGKGDWPI